MKIVLVGDAKVGKTTFVNILKGENFKEEYIATLGVEVSPLRRENKILNVWDCAGDERFRGLGDGYYIQTQGAIIMCDCENHVSILNILKWEKDLIRAIGDKPILVILNKSENLDEDEKRKINETLQRKTLFISCKEKINIENIFQFF
jgi:GTP-binding nuclear protein Ran